MNLIVQSSEKPRLIETVAYVNKLYIPLESYFVCAFSVYDDLGTISIKKLITMGDK
jgi:hypothetical protein